MAIPRLYVDGVRYYKIGVGLVDLMPQEHVQYDLFTPPTEEPRLMCVLDKLNQRYGSDTVFVAAQGIDPKWHMRRDMLTPQYTTDWRQIPLIQCR
jgi:DNA polymerase V